MLALFVGGLLRFRGGPMERGVSATTACSGTVAPLVRQHAARRQFDHQTIRSMILFAIGMRSVSARQVVSARTGQSRPIKQSIRIARSCPYRLARLSEVNPPRIPQSPHGTRQGVFTNTPAHPFVLSIFRELRSNVCASDLSIIPSTQEAVT